MRCLSLRDLARPNSVLKVVFYNLLFFNKAVCFAIDRSNSTLLRNGDGCTSSADWLGHSINVEDCSGTINKLYRIEVLKHGMNVFEFLGNGVHPEYEYPVMQTPRRYSVGKPLTPYRFLQFTLQFSVDVGEGACTLVLAMLDVFPDGDLPNVHEGPLYTTDIASFRDIEFLARDLVLNCVLLRHSAGYRVAGK